MPEREEQARALREQGLTYEQIADALGTSKGTAWRWSNPDAAERWRDAAERWRAQSRAWKERNRERIIRAYDADGGGR